MRVASKPVDKRRGRWWRLAGYLTVLLCASTWWTVHRVSAEVAERSLSFGRQLDRMSEIAKGATTLELNGAQLTVTTIVREQSVPALLDRFSALCARDSGGVSEQLDELARKGAHIPEPVAKGSFGVFRVDKEGREGTAACFARTGDGGLMETIRRLDTVLDTGDFAALGQLRYMFVRRIDERQTHAITVSSHGALPLARMFPELGDAPGYDVLEGVRPVAARRLLSARAQQSDLQTAMYESRAAPDVALASYDAPMQARGYELGDLSHVAGSLVAGTRVYLRADQAVLVIAEARDGLTAVSSFRLPGVGFVTVR
jgi:hypothetical protein